MVASLVMTVAPRLPAIGPAAAEVRAFLARYAVDEVAVYTTDLVFEELLSNVVRHAGGAVPLGPGGASVCVTVDQDTVELRVHDRGIAFDPTLPPESAPGSPRADGRVGGFGLPLVRQFADELHYERAEGENRLRVRIARNG